MWFVMISHIHVAESEFFGNFNADHIYRVKNINDRSINVIKKSCIYGVQIDRRFFTDIRQSKKKYERN